MAIQSEPRPDRRPEWLRRKHTRDPAPRHFASLMAEARQLLGTHDGGSSPVHGGVFTSVLGDDGTEYPIGSEDEARSVIREMYASHRAARLRDDLALSARAGQAEDGTWQVTWQFFTKGEGRRKVIELYGPDPANWPYDPMTMRARRGGRANGEDSPATAPEPIGKPATTARCDACDIGYTRPITASGINCLGCGKPMHPVALLTGIDPKEAGKAARAIKNAKPPKPSAAEKLQRWLGN